MTAPREQPVVRRLVDRVAVVTGGASGIGLADMEGGLVKWRAEIAS